MKADRLVATLLLIQTRGKVTAAEVADELEVSLATARRDLEALAAAGVPVYPQSGRRGGWSLVGGGRTDLSGLTAGEARALFLLVGPAVSVAPELKSALRKLVRALPVTFRADAENAASAVMVDPVRWGDHQRQRPALVDLLQTAVVGRRKVRLGYTNRAGVERAWFVDPLGLVDKDDIWYLVAQTESGERTFRVDRVRDAQVTEEPAVHTVDFDLEAAWQRVVSEVEEQRSLLAATVLVDARLVSVLQGQFGRHCQVGQVVGDDRCEVTVAAPSALMIAQHLAGWGSQLEVLGPRSVRAELARMGAELVASYGKAGPAGAHPR